MGRGSLRRDLGTLQSYAALIGILVGAGIYQVTQDAYAITGPSVVLGYLVLAPVVLAAAVPYAAFQSTPLALGPGGDYAHIRAVFGCSVVAFLAAWLKLISYLGALVLLAVVLAGYLIELLGILGLLTIDAAELDTAKSELATACLVGFWVVHCLGVRWFGRVQVLMCALLGVSILTLVVPGVFAIRGANFTPFFAGDDGSFLASLAPLFFAYAGFEALAHSAGEVRESQTRLPRIYLRGVLATAVLFVAMSAVVVGVLPARQMAESKAPMATAAETFLPGVAAWVVALGGVLAAATSVNATMAVPPRLSITVADDGLLPASLARIHAGTGTPVRGLTIALLISLVLLWSGQNGFALGIAVLALLVVYFLHTLAFLLLPVRNPELAREVASGRPRWLQRSSAWAALVALGILIFVKVHGDYELIVAVDAATELPRSFVDRFASGRLTSIELFLAWSIVGAGIYWTTRRTNSPVKE